MELAIYNKEGKLKANISPADSSSLSEGVMTDSVLSLSFTDFDCIAFDVNDYIDFLGRRYWLLEAYTPNQKSTIEWLYSVKFYGIEGVIRRALCLKTVDNELNPLFSLTAPAIEHVRLVVGNINRVMGTTNWKVGEVLSSANLTIDYNATYCDAALTSIATAASTEWWIDGLTVNLCRCEYGALTELGYGRGLREITLDTNENAKFFTRLFPLGSNRNIDAAKYGSTRLRLPGGVKYLEQNTHYGVIEHSEEAAFADIYPKRIGRVGAVRKETKTGENGKPFDIYYFTDPVIDFNPNDYEIGGLVKSIAFETGDLAGRDFEVNYDAENKEFEVITQFPYDDDTQLPGVLVMKSGDEYILYNITMPTQYYTRAEQEFAAAVAAYMERNKRDKSVYKAPTDYIDLAEREITLFVGQRVRLLSNRYFPVAGYRDSRISRITRRVHEPLMADIEISDLADPGGKAVLNQNVSDAKHYAQTAMAGLPDIVKSWENTPASDSNLYSAKKSIRAFVSRLYDDAVAGMITFFKGIKIGHFIPGWIGSGGALYIDPVTGKSKLEVDEVLARDRFEAMEFRFNRIDVIDGEQWSTFAFGKITSVDVENQVAYLDLVDGELMSSHVNDLNRGIFHNISSDNAAGNKMDDCGFYTMAGFSTSYFTPTELLPGGFKYALRPGTTQHPCAEMKFAAYGNLTDSERRMSRVTNTRHTLYLKEVSTWQIDPNAHYGAAYGDLTGITINGVEFNGYSSFQTNGYFKGYIEFLPDQIEELKGNDGYSVSLTSYDAIVGVDSQGRIDHAIYDIVNIVNGEEQVVSGDSEVVATRYKIGTDIQAFKGGQALVYATTPSEGMYAASYTAIGCECYLNDGVMVITKVTADKATVKIEVNCEGKAVFIKLFTLTRVYGGVNADWIINVFCQSEEKPDAPTGEALMPEGWSDAPTGVGKWWMSKSIVNGITRLPGEWSEPVQVTCEDGGDTDFKYAKNSSESVPPSIVITDRFPNGWIDEPPMLHAGEFLWMSTMKVKPDNTLNGTWSIPVRISGEKGYAGDWTSYVFKQSQGRPSTPTGTHPKPSGWDDGPGSEGKWWMSKSSVSGVTGEARDWSTPVQVTGQDGNGMYYEYAAHHSQTDAPAGGWSPLVPAIGSGQFLWMRWGQVIPPATHPQSWAGVARVTGETGPRGQQGIQGIQGEDGRQGLTGPAGEDGSTTYFHIKYSHNPDGNPMTEDASAPYIGTYVDYYSVDSSSHYSYTWKRFQGLQGASGTQGIPGNNGHDGKTYYTHIKYSNDGGRTFTSSSGETPGDYIGFCVDLNVNDPTTVGAYKWSKTKGETGNPGEPGRPGEDANLLPWINDWNNNKTLVDNEYVVSPKMFSGTRSGNGKLTGIAQGRDCITINGAKRTGIFALVDNEVVFALDPITKEYKFRGRIEATEGEIGGFSLVGNNLVNENFGASVSIRDQDNGRYVTIGGKNNTIDVLVYGSNSTGLFIMSGDSASNDTSYAIQSYGRHFFGQRQGDTWNAPGVLWCGSYSVINWNPVLINQWGNGVRNTPSISRTGNGKYTITHGLGHTEYFVSGTAKNKTYEGDWYNSVMNYESISYNSFLVQFKCDGSKEKDPSEFQIMIFGRNKW